MNFTMKEIKECQGSVGINFVVILKRHLPNICLIVMML